MILDTLKSDGLMNIHDFSQEDPLTLQRTPFDPARDITDIDWQHMNAHMCVTNNQSQILCRMRLLQLGTSRTFTVPGDLGTIVYEMRRHLGTLESCPLSVLYAAPTFISHTPNASHVSHILLPLWKNLASNPKIAEIENWSGLAETGVKILCTDPLRKNDLGVDEEKFAGMRTEIQNKLERARKGETTCPADDASIMKMFFSFYGKEFRLSDGDWDGIKNELQSYRAKEQWGLFAGYAMKMLILAAHKLRFDPVLGLQITLNPPKNPVNAIGPLPTVTQFASSLNT